MARKGKITSHPNDRFRAEIPEDFIAEAEASDELPGQAKQL
jgi:hypothetical protein